MTKKQVDDAQSEDEDPADGRADDPGRVHDDAVEAHRVGEEVETDHFGDERLPGRIVEQVDHAEQRREGEDQSQVHRVGDHEQAERERQQPGRGLRGVEDLALVETVGDQPTEGTEKEKRKELEPDGHGDVDAGAVELEQDEVRLGHRLHPRARDRDDLPGEVQAVVPDRQGRERAVAGIGEAAH